MLDFYSIDLSNNRVITKIIGHQWYWEYESRILDEEIISCFMSAPASLDTIFRLITTDSLLILPNKTQHCLVVSSYDVLHAWTLPSLGLKMDAIPGRLNIISFYAFKSGIYFGQCSELCGVNHAFIPIQLFIAQF